VLAQILLLVQDDRFHLLDVAQALRPVPWRRQMMQRMISAMPWMSSSAPASGMSAFNGKTGMPAGLKMLTSRCATERIA
jgi:hypothetical protein